MNRGMKDEQYANLENAKRRRENLRRLRRSLCCHRYETAMPGLRLFQM